MGRSVTPTFRVEFKVADARRRYTAEAWPTRHLGRPSDAALLRWVESFEASTREGGCNAHLGAEEVREARVVRQSTGDAVAEYLGRRAESGCAS